MQLNGASVGSPVTLRPGGTFTSIVTAPSAPGTCVLFTTYTPTGLADIAYFALPSLQACNCSSHNLARATKQGV